MNLVLIVDSDELSRSATKSFLHSSGFNVLEAENSEKALQLIDSVTLSAAIIDYELSDSCGLELLKNIKKAHHENPVPIITLGPCCNDSAKVKSLENGADDVISKPIPPAELILRLKNIIKLYNGIDRSVNTRISLNGISMDMQSLQITIDGKNTDLSLSEFRLLYHFMSNPNKAFSRHELCLLTKGTEAKLDERSIDVYIMRLRKSLLSHGYEHLIQTVRGVGYRFSRQ